MSGYPDIDGYYTDNFHCFYNSFYISTTLNPRVPDYNKAKLLIKIEDINKRILFATGDEAVIGNGQGFRMHNAGEPIDSRFMASFPPLQALYLIPGNYFSDVGNYGSPMQWIPKLNATLQPQNRQFNNISGIDIYVAYKKDYETIPQEQKLGLSLIYSSMSAKLEQSLVILEDKRSNGMVYMAKKIHYLAPDLHRYDKMIKYFRTWKNADLFANMKIEIDSLREKLLDLKSPQEVIIEDSVANFDQTLASNGNQVLTEGIIDNRAAFKVHCEEEPCILVYNAAGISGWRAFSDQTEIPIKPANFAFMSVKVPLGNHLVWFENRSIPVTWGFYFTFLTYIFALGTLLFFPEWLPKFFKSSHKYDRRF
jgi:hypothetical protein